MPVRTEGPPPPSPRPVGSSGVEAPSGRDAADPAETGRSRLLADAGTLLAGRLAVAALGWAGTLLIVRSLSVDEFGRFTFIFGFLGLVATLTEFGIGRVAVAGILDEEHDRGAFAGAYVLLRTALGLGGYVAAVAVVALAGYPGDVIAGTAVAALALVIATPSHAYVAVFQAENRLRPIATASLLGQLSQIALTAAIAAAGGSMLLFTIPAVVGEVVIIAWHWRCARRLLALRYRLLWGAWAGLFREAVPLAIGGAMATAYYRIDSVMLSKLDTFAAVGVYGVAYKFVDVVHFVSTAVMIATLPVLVRAWPEQPEAFRDGFRRAFTILMLAAVLVVAEFLLFAEPVIATLYGPEYRAGADATRVVVAAECIAFFGSLAFTALVAAGRHRLYPFATFVGVVLNVGLNLWLIRAWSYQGAAITTLVTEVVVVGLLWAILLRQPGLRPSRLGRAARALPCGVAAVLAGALLDRLLPWPLAAVGTAVVFVAVVEVAGAAGAGGLRALAGRATEPSS
ncbi:MAG: oligosaccharide flippase family protein [Actinobacteria bacterium]|nr:oligosaccharide flippase family protein [Actinomycetota bacterium]MBW3648938.1 oligosaccharide flippase family protein [Actinomycetota bacterium]